MKGHVGALSRPVHREVAQGDGGHAVVDVVEVAELLGRELRDAVRRHRLGQRVLGHGNGGRVPVDRRARRVDDPLDGPADQGLEQDLGRLDVVGRVGAEIATPALPNARLRGQVEDVRDGVGQRGEVGPLQLGLDEGEARLAPEPRQVGLLDVPPVVVREAVESDHRGPALDERLGELRSDEAGDSGDQCLHANA